MTRWCCAALLAFAVFAAPASAQTGDDLFIRDCSSCHGPDGEGVEPGPGPRGVGNVAGAGPPLRGVGERSARFYLTTGYMPLRSAHEQPKRGEPQYTEEELEALVAYVASLGGGPRTPDVDPARGDLEPGFRAYTQYCAGCHQSVAAGGVVLAGTAPPLDDAAPAQIAAAVRIGPNLMPPFSERQIDDETLDSIVRYVLYARDPVDDGGWPLGHLGPIPEGLVAWFVGLVVLAGLARVLGERSE